MKKILIAVALAAFVAPVADAAGRWHGRRSPKNAAIFHSMDGPGRAAFHVISGPVRAGEDENRGRCDDLPPWLIEKEGRLKSGHIYTLRIDEGALTGFRHKRKNLSTGQPSPCALTEDTPAIAFARPPSLIAPLVGPSLLTVGPGPVGCEPVDCEPVDCEPNLGLALDLGFLCGGLFVLEKDVADAKGGPDHHKISPLTDRCKERLSP